MNCNKIALLHHVTDLYNSKAGTHEVDMAIRDLYI